MMLVRLCLALFSALISFPSAIAMDDGPSPASINNFAIFSEEIYFFSGGLSHSFEKKSRINPSILKLDKPIKLDNIETYCYGKNAYSDVDFKPKQFQFEPLQLENNLVFTFKPQEKEDELEFTITANGSFPEPYQNAIPLKVAENGESVVLTSQDGIKLRVNLSGLYTTKDNVILTQSSSKLDILGAKKPVAGKVYKFTRGDLIHYMKVTYDENDYSCGYGNYFIIHKVLEEQIPVKNGKKDEGLPPNPNTDDQQENSLSGDMNTVLLVGGGLCALVIIGFILSKLFKKAPRAPVKKGHGLPKRNKSFSKVPKRARA